MKLANVDLTKKLDKKEYKKRIKAAQMKLLRREEKIMHERESVIVLFEGWDASGKGGAIKRITEYLDPRGYVAHPIGAPTAGELAQHYLWRFWQKMPHKGQLAIFDRSWYGRVLVERVEKFATKKEWSRSYDEINAFEKTLTDNGVTLVKFFIHIDKKEQLKRFREREADKLKNWKITPDDWRNRKKWNEYVEAADEMFARTSTEHAPWHVIPGNDKNLARVLVAETVAKALKNV